MGIESTDSPKFSDNKQQSPGLEPKMNQDGQNSKEILPESVFINSEPVREELVQMAVKFLSHPTVRGSPIIHRRSFLQKKGLTQEEIDEAFRRVPDPSIGQGTTLNQDAQSKLVTESQPQGSAQSLQAPPVNSDSAVSRLSIVPPYRLYWSHFFVALGLFTASGIGTVMFLKKFIFPRLKIWIRKAVFEEHGNGTRNSEGLQEATEAAKAAATAAVNVTKASLAMLNSKNEEKRYFEALAKRLDIQVAEVKSMANAIWKLEGAREAVLSSRKHHARHASKNVRPSSAPASVRPYVGQHPNSYIENMATIQRREAPPDRKEINDLRPSFSQSLANPWFAPKTKPWELAEAQNNSYALHPHVHNEGSKIQVFGTGPQLNDDNSVPWWHTNVKITKSESHNEMPSWLRNNSRIAELKAENGAATSHGKLLDK